MYQTGTKVTITDRGFDADIDIPLPDDFFPPSYFAERSLGAVGEVICGFNTRWGAAYLITINDMVTFVYESELECYAEISFKDKNTGLGDWLTV